MVFDRKLYLQRLIDCRGNGMVKLVTGVVHPEYILSDLIMIQGENLTKNGHFIEPLK